MNVDEIAAWAREDNLECPFRGSPTDCEDAREVAGKLAAHMQELCGDDRGLICKVTWIMEYASIIADIT